MKRVLGLAVATLVLSGAGEAPRNLDECFQAAIHRSETISERDLEIEIARERERQARGSILPNLSAAGSYTRQEQPSNPLYRSFAPADQPEAKVVLTQPLFRGFRELATMRQMASLTTSQEQAKAQALDQLFIDVAQNYYTILATEQDIRNLKAELSEYKARQTELEKRVRTGQSNRSDALVAEASASSAETQLRTSEGQLTVARQTFSFLTGLSPDTALTDDVGEPGEPPPLAPFLTHLDDRPDIAAAKARLKAADENIWVQKGQYLPSADLTGEYYLKRPPGFLSEIHWDVVASLTIPIYSGGVTTSQVHQAEATHSEAGLEVQRLSRSAENDVRTDHATLANDVAQYAGLERTAKLSRRNYVQLKNDYLQGLNSNVDVLLALTQFQANQRAADRQRYVARLDLLKLRTDAGQRAAAEKTR